MVPDESVHCRGAEVLARIRDGNCMWSGLAALQFFEDSLSGDGLVAILQGPRGSELLRQRTTIRA